MLLCLCYTKVVFSCTPSGQIWMVTYSCSYENELKYIPINRCLPRKYSLLLFFLLLLCHRKIKIFFFVKYLNSKRMLDMIFLTQVY